MIVLFVCCYWNNKIMEDDVSGACSTHQSWEMDKKCLLKI